MSWDLRIHIALDVARGLEYLHDGVNFHLIYALEYGPMCVFCVKTCLHVDYGSDFFLLQALRKKDMISIRKINSLYPSMRSGLLNLILS